MDWNRLDGVQLVRHYCAAHTAVELYRHLREDPGVIGVLGRCSSPELADELRRLLERPVSIDRNARAYCLLVALAVQSPQAARSLVLGGDIDELRWAQGIVNAADGERR